MTPRRILLKVSGEVLAGSKGTGVSHEVCEALASGIRFLTDQSIQVGMVVGGGNYTRGATLSKGGFPRCDADYIGMLATIMNGVTLRGYFEKKGLTPRVMSGLDCPQVVEPFDDRKAKKALSNGEVLIFVGGTGSPYFTTDTAAALRACEIEADLLMKATKVDGVYSTDPKKDPSAERFAKLTFQQALEKDIEVMDRTAFALCQSDQIPICVFKMDLLLTGEKVPIKSILESGSLISIN